MSKRLECLKDFEDLVINDKVTLLTKKGRTLNGTIDDTLTNRGYIDLNEIDVYIDELDCTLTVNVDKYLSDSGTLKDFILIN